MSSQFYKKPGRITEGKRVHSQPLKLPGPKDEYSHDASVTGKTALGKARYESSTPPLLLIDIDITTDMPVDTPKAYEESIVVSQNLRRQVLPKYVEEAVNQKQDLANRIVFDFDARSPQVDAVKNGENVGQCNFKGVGFGRTNRIIIPLEDEETGDEIFSLFDQSRTLDAPKKVASRAKKLENPGEDLDRKITCTIVRRGLLIKPDCDPRDLYRRCIQLLFRQYCFDKQPKPTWGTPAEFLIHDQNWHLDEETSAGDGSPTKDKDSDLSNKSSTQRTVPWQYGVRCKPQCDNKLHMWIEFDLVPFLKDKGSVAEYASHRLRASLRESSITNELSELLRGLRVRYPFADELRKTYKDIATKAKWAFEERPNDEEEAASSQERTYTIRQIHPNSYVGKVIHKEVQNEKGEYETKGFTIKQYLKHCNAPLEKRFAHLPLADIGKNNRPFWVPLDLLTFYGDQVPPEMKLHTQVLQEIRSTLNPMDILSSVLKPVDNEDPAAPKNSFFDQTDALRKADVALPFPSSSDKPYSPLKAVPLETKPPRVTQYSQARKTPNPWIAIVYVTQRLETPATDSFLEDVKQALLEERKKVDGQVTLEITESKLVGIQARSVSDLLRRTEQKDFLDFQKKIDAVIGIVDKESVGESNYDETVAAIKRLGDTKIGAVTVCIEKKPLEEHLKRRLTGGKHKQRVYFPQNVLRKIRAMLGVEVWATPELSRHLAAHYEDGLIIIGAHISEPGPDSTEGCPAVAALVMTKKFNHTLYEAAVQLQEGKRPFTVDPPTPSPLGLKKLSRDIDMFQPEISCLKSTLKQYFNRWMTSSRERVPMPRVVFYRDSYNPTDNKTHKEEAKKISEAYSEAYSDVNKSKFNQDVPTVPLASVPLTYITVSKTRSIHSEAESDAASKDEVSQSPVTFRTSVIEGSEEQKEDAGKYQYTVRCNQSNLARATLQKLTALLNVSSQMCEYTSLALPVHYARKLARRVLSYYDYMSRKNISNFLEVSRNNNVTGTDQLHYVRQLLGTNNQNEHPWHNKLNDRMFFI